MEAIRLSTRSINPDKTPDEKIADLQTENAALKNTIKDMQDTVDGLVIKALGG